MKAVLQYIMQSNVEINNDRYVTYLNEFQSYGCKKLPKINKIEKKLFDKMFTAFFWSIPWYPGLVVKDS